MGQGGAIAPGVQSEALDGLDRALASPLTGFAPWVVLYVVGGTGRVALACGIALVMSVLTLSLERARGKRLTWLSYADTAAFGAFLLGSFTASPSTISWFEDWFSECGYLFVVAVLGGSVLAGHPLSTDYAKEHVDPVYWDSPEFRRVNRLVTSVWALAFLGAALAGLVTDLVLQYDDNIWTNWVLPIASVMAAVAWTTWYAQHTMARSLQEAGLPTDPPAPTWDLWRVLAAFLVPMGLVSLLFDGGPPALGFALILAGTVLPLHCRRQAAEARAITAQATGGDLPEASSSPAPSG